MGLLDLPGWKQFKTSARREQKMLRMANQAKLPAFRCDPVYQFGIKVPRSPQEGIKHRPFRKHFIMEAMYAGNLDIGMDGGMVDLKGTFGFVIGNSSIGTIIAKGGGNVPGAPVIMSLT